MKLVHEGQYIAEVDIDLIAEDMGGHATFPLKMHRNLMRSIKHFEWGIFGQLVDSLVFTLLPQLQFNLKWDHVAGGDHIESSRADTPKPQLKN